MSLECFGTIGHHLILFGTIRYYLDIDIMEQARAELGKAQIILGLGCTNMINKKYPARSLARPH